MLYSIYHCSFCTCFIIYNNMTSCCTDRTSLKRLILRSIKPGIFVAAICATILLFSIPVVLYYVTLYTVFGDAPAGQPILDIIDSISNNSTSDCSSSSWAAIEAAVVNCEPYAGELCLPYLTQWSRCLVPSQNETVNIAVYSDAGKTQAELDEDLSQLVSALEIGGDCQTMAIPFLCHYYFPTIASDCQSDATAQVVYTATQEECVSIRDGVCALPYTLAISGGYGDSLPECSSLPTRNFDTNNSNNSNDSMSIDELISCRPDFILINSTCFPRCDLFKEESSQVMEAILDAQFVSVIIAMLVCITTFSMAIYYRKKMFAFPAYFLLFIVFDVFIVSLLYLIASINRTKLFCSSINLIETVNNPTFYCTFSGAVLHYMVANLSLWWFFHFCVTYYYIMFPFSSREMEILSRKKYLAIVLTILGFLLPLPAVIISLSSEKLSYGLGRFPPDLCIPNGTLWFYSCIFPFTIMLCFCVCFLISILWVSQKYQPSSSAFFHLSTANKKIVLIAIHFIVFGVFVMAHNGVVVGNVDKVSQGFVVYFLCESTGYTPGKCDRSSFEQYLYPSMSVIAYILMGTFPLAILNFVVNWKDLWKSIKHQCITHVASCKKKNYGSDNSGYENRLHQLSADSSSS